MFSLVSAWGIIAMQPPQGEGPGGFLGNPIFLVVMIVIMFYFILYKPEKKRKQDRENMLKNLKRGDDVMSAGGILGKVTALTDQTVTMEVAPGVKLRVSRQHVSLVTAGQGSDKSSDDSDRSGGDGKKKKK